MKAASSPKSKGSKFRAAKEPNGSAVLPPTLAPPAPAAIGAESPAVQGPSMAKPQVPARPERAKRVSPASSPSAEDHGPTAVVPTPREVRGPEAGPLGDLADDLADALDSVLPGDLPDELGDELAAVLEADLPAADDRPDPVLESGWPVGSGSALDGAGLTRGPRIRLTPSQLIADHRVNSPLDRLDLDEVWRMYRAQPTTEVRNYLWQRYLPLVRYNAERVYSRLPDEVDLDNLIQAGSFGLKDAIASFDLDRGVKFETFCAQRIRGAILDELRSMDWVPRLVRHRTSRVEQVRERMRAQRGVRPTDEEIAVELGCEEEEVKKVLKDGRAVNMSSLSKQRYQSDGSREVREIDVIHDSRQSDPLSEVQRNDLKSLLCKGLSRAERLIVILYYYEGMTMKEIGLTLDLSESRVSQMHSLILMRLKAQMQHREGEFDDEE